MKLSKFKEFLKLKKCHFSAVINLKDTDGIANCVDPDKTAPLGAV